MKKTYNTISAYNSGQTKSDTKICELLRLVVSRELEDSESKIWHGAPVWFLDGNPIVGYSKQKAGIRLMFWSGSDFAEDSLAIRGDKFKDASIFFTSFSQINTKDLSRWLKKSRDIQWDYKNIVKRKGVLVRVRTNNASAHDQRFANMTFASVYPLYLTKIEKKGRTKEELDQVITWLTGYDKKEIQELIIKKVTFEDFFKNAKLSPNAHLITGIICGYRIEEIANPLTKQVRCLDKLVDELAKGRKMEKILRI